MMTYEQAVEYLDRFSKSGTPVHDLVRFVILMRSLGNPQNNIKTIHIAGTNGKGSVCEYISNAVQAAGKTVGKFTSPYITCIEERIQINGKNISRQAFALLCDKVRNAVIAGGYDGYSQFEILSAVAFLYFNNEKVNYAVIETGIGGALDCTNIINPEISVITSVDYDHTAVLGSTLAEIAWHKAGIIKPSVPCVISPGQPEEVMSVLNAKCREFNSKEIIPDMSRVSILHMDMSDVFFSYVGMNYHSHMSGHHQIKNALCAVEACRALGIDYSSIFTGIEKSRLPARMEAITRDNVRYIIDGSHNPSAARAAASFLGIEHTPVYAVIGMLDTKDWQGALSEMMDCFEDIIFVDGFAPNCVPASQLAEYALSKGVKCEVQTDMYKAVDSAADKARKGGCAMITGSLYLASAVRKQLVPEE